MTEKQCCKMLNCETKDCAYNCDGECRFASVKNRPPHITEEDGCIEGVIVFNNCGSGMSSHSIVEAPIGRLVAEKCADPDYPGLRVYVNGEKINDQFWQGAMDICLIEYSVEDKQLRIIAYGDGNEEDYTHLIPIKNVLKSASGNKIPLPDRKRIS